ncbi:MAG: hypothetical protein EOO24_24145 [Comamonadaceae bacterium]|nr:MAG: hypothetical protein EOO24_24145 [Comamonadaceae bacterium]
MKRIPSLVLAAAGLFAAVFVHAADPYPSRPIRILVGFPPGGGADSIARLMADHMGKTLKQPVLVENRPGANTTLAPAAVAAAAPDGYTLLLGADAVFGADKAMFAATVKYDESSFTPVNRIASTYFVLAANKDAGIKRFSDVAAKAKEAGKPLFLASPGGAYLQIVASDLNRMSGLNLEEVPYKGGAPAAMAVMSGEATLTLMAPGALLPLVREGRIAAVATTNARRSALTPGIPTLASNSLRTTSSGASCSTPAPPRSRIPSCATSWRCWATSRRARRRRRSSVPRPGRTAHCCARACRVCRHGSGGRCRPVGGQPLRSGALSWALSPLPRVAAARLPCTAPAPYPTSRPSRPPRTTSTCRSARSGRRWRAPPPAGPTGAR